MVTRAQARAKARRDEFHAAMGYCIAEWANIENELFHICLELIGHPQQTAIIYYRLPGIDIRLGLVDELILASFPVIGRKSGGHRPKIVNEWKTVHSSIKELLSVRRAIAHYPVSETHNALAILMRAGFSAFNTSTLNASTLGGLESYWAKYSGPWLSLGPAENERLREKISDQSSIGLKGLADHLESCRTTKAKVHAFYVSMVTHRALSG
jgi:hypothetical protein